MPVLPSPSHPLRRPGYLHESESESECDAGHVDSFTPLLAEGQEREGHVFFFSHLISFRPGKSLPFSPHLSFQPSPEVEDGKGPRKVKSKETRKQSPPWAPKNAVLFSSSARSAEPQKGEERKSCTRRVSTFSRCPCPLALSSYMCCPEAERDDFG